MVAECRHMQVPASTHHSQACRNMLKETTSQVGCIKGNFFFYLVRKMTIKILVPNSELKNNDTIQRFKKADTQNIKTNMVQPENC